MQKPWNQKKPSLGRGVHCFKQEMAKIDEMSLHVLLLKVDSTLGSLNRVQVHLKLFISSTCTCTCTCISATEAELKFLITGLLIFHTVAEPRISSKSAKSHEIHRNTRNPAKFPRNLTKYMSAQHIWKLSWLVGLLTCCKLATCNLPWNFVTAASKQHPKTTRCS